MHAAISADPAEILKSRELDVVPYAGRVGALADRLGLDFSATIHALEAIPLCQSRERHPAVRRAMAEMVAARTEDLRRAIPGIVARSTTALTRPGRVDVMAEVVMPMVSDMISGLIEMPFDVAETGQISRVFSQALGVAKRRRMEEELARLTETLRARFPALDEEAIGLKLSLSILGRDALLGTFGCSLHAMADQAAGRSFAALDWPDLPPRTGVPYIDRVALVSVRVGDRPVDPGGNIRARLADYEGSDDPRAGLSFFGAGAHLCLGRALSLDLWRAMTAALSASPMVPRVLAYGLRRDDVFHIPETFDLEVSAP